MIRFGGRWQRSPASFIAALIAALTLLATPSGAVELEPIEVDGQPLGAQALVFALLMSEEPALQQAQLRHLPRAAPAP